MFCRVYEEESWVEILTLGYFGKMNSTLGSVVPLAMFFYASNHDLVKEASVYKLVKEELHVPHLVVEALT